MQSAAMMRACVLLAVVVLATARTVEYQQGGANPIRKVVNMLQNMQKKVTAEGATETGLFEKFMCYCQNSGGDLQGSITAAESKIPEVGSAIKAGTAEKAQLEQDLKEHKAARADGKATMAEATERRAKDAGAFATESGDLKTNIGALGGAIAAVTKGMAAGFLQTTAAAAVRKLALSGPAMQDADRQDLLSFLSGQSSDNYAPKGGEISGILKGLKDDMDKSLASATADENESIKAHEELMAAKAKEVAALTKAIEEKSQRAGELAVELANQANDLEDTQEALAADKEFAANLDKTCAEKTALHEENVKMRSMELVALSETIKVLNDDDAMELFKKTLPTPTLMQIQVNTESIRIRALAILKKVAPGLEVNFVEMALKGKKVGFAKVIKMIDNMVETLKTEQADDDQKKEYCAKEFDSSEDKKKSLEQTIADHETAIEDAEENAANLKAEIKALEDGIKALDKSVQEATEQRKEENTEVKELMANDSAAKEVLGWARNRLNKFYNPKLYKAPPKRELSEASLVQVLASRHSREAPPPAPESPVAYSKSSEESGGVVAMIDLLVKDLDKEMQEAGVEEKEAQSEYEQLMKESAEKRAADAKSISEKSKAKSDLQATAEMHKEEKASAGKELMATASYIASLHSECDWLVQYYDVRKTARADEVDALGKAKAVLSGADFSLLQARSADKNILRRK